MPVGVTVATACMYPHAWTACTQQNTLPRVAVKPELVRQAADVVEALRTDPRVARGPTAR